MVTNFDYLKNDPQFAPFANVEQSKSDGICCEVDVFCG